MQWRVQRPGEDQKTVDIYERYTNAHAAHVHVTENFGPNFSKRVHGGSQASTLRGVRCCHGRASKKTLADFRPIYMTPFDGFTK